MTSNIHKDDIRKKGKSLLDQAIRFLYCAKCERPSNGLINGLCAKCNTKLPNKDKEKKPSKKAAGVTVKHQARRVKISRPGDNRYAPKTDRGDSSAPKPSKKIEVVIHKMIDICLYLGHIPYELYLSEEDYSKLIEETMAYEPSGMKIIDNGIEYRKEKVPLEITNYCGVPVYRSAKNRTSLLWR